MNKYDLEDRTLSFSKSVISLCKQIPHNNVNKAIVDQLIRSATSIGANYREATGASSKKDFKNKIHICKKEAQETKYWLDLLGGDIKTKGIESLADEANQFVLIFGKITSTISKNINSVNKH